MGSCTSKKNIEVVQPRPEHEFDAYQKAALITNKETLHQKRKYEQISSFKAADPSQWRRNPFQREKSTNRVFKRVMSGESLPHRRPIDIENMEGSITFREKTDFAGLYEKYPELQKTLAQFNKAVKYLKSKTDSDYYEDMGEFLYTKVLTPFKTSFNSDHRKLMAYHMAKVGFAKAATVYYQSIIENERISIRTIRRHSDIPSIQLLELLRDIVWQFTGPCKKLGYKFGQAGFLMQIADELAALKKHINKEEVRFAIVSALGILHHCARSESNRRYYYEADAAHQLIPFLQCDVPEIKTGAITVLSYITDEEEDVASLVDDSVLTYIVGVLRSAMESPDRRSNGYKAVELVEGLTALATSDGNKACIAHKGVLPLLTELLDVGDEEEKGAAARAMWVLAFDKENKQKLKNEPKLVSLLEQLQGSKVMDDRINADGALWVIKKQDEGPVSKRKGTRNSGRDGPYGQDDQELPHVMISYCWDDQHIMLRIRDSLVEAGYRVWMDVDGMSGSILQAMAEAIENSAVVIIALSESYKNSPNCRTEAEYAYRLGKPMVPVQVQTDYEPHGWLGAIMGTKQYITFAGKINYDNRILDLIKELGDKGNVFATLPPEYQEMAKRDLASKWTVTKVRAWLDEKGLPRKAALWKLTGRQLLYLKNLRNEAPEFYYKYLQNELDLQELPHIIQFNDALETL